MNLLPKSPSIKATDDMMTGEAYIDLMHDPSVLGRTRFVAVHFSPGGRLRWHTHVLGQTLYITEGKGLVQARGEKILEVGAGDVVWVTPNEWHWHGATLDHFMTHIAVTDVVSEGANDEWGDHVSDAEIVRDLQ